AYDAHGNLIDKRIGKHTQIKLEWDAEHQLRTSHVSRNAQQHYNPVEQTTHYGYDPFGRRLFKRDAFGVTRFVWDGNRLLSESRGSKSRTYLYEPESFVPLAQVDSNTPAPTKDGKEQQKTAQLLYFHKDHLGTPRELTDAQGNLRWAASYKAWGNVLLVETPQVQRSVKAMPQAHAETDEIAQPLRFQGQYYDAETGLHYNRFRYYDPDCGRFVSLDPIGLRGGDNLYQYASNPMGWSDPLGLAPCKKCDPCAIAAHSDQPSPRPTGQQSHHIIQDAWAQANVPGYSRGSAPAVLLTQSPNHATVTALQNARRDARIAAGQPKWGTSMDEEFNNSYRDLGAAGMSEKCKRKAIKKAYKHFYGG
ncbi:MAG: RHS repeat-associated core domain-containing protein, partial [Formivibrio sp.]|nr:RHS repeat-associated core domain-containing protein [Formivibrio sp.]